MAMRSKKDTPPPPPNVQGLQEKHFLHWRAGSQGKMVKEIFKEETGDTGFC